VADEVIQWRISESRLGSEQISSATAKTAQQHSKLSIGTDPYRLAVLSIFV
jgi:hypothetical protein